jgi:hypothetical protein
MFNLSIKSGPQGKLITENIVLLLPGISYWISAGMAQVFGTDYFYDVVFAQLKTNFSGRLFFGIIILVFPIVSLAINLLTSNKKTQTWVKWSIVLGGVMTVGGALALGRLFLSS